MKMEQTITFAYQINRTDYKQTFTPPYVFIPPATGCRVAKEIYHYFNLAGGPSLK